MTKVRLGERGRVHRLNLATSYRVTLCGRFVDSARHRGNAETLPDDQPVTCTQCAAIERARVSRIAPRQPVDGDARP